MEDQYKAKLEEWKLRQEGLMYAAGQKYEKYIVTLSAGALPLSVTIFLHFQKEVSNSVLPWIFSAWIMWTLAVLVVVVSFKASYKSHLLAIKQISDEKMLDRIYDDKEQLGGIWSRVTTTLTDLALFMFIAGVISFLIFSTLTMKGASMSKNNNSRPQRPSGGTTQVGINIKGSVPEKNTLPTRQTTGKPGGK